MSGKPTSKAERTRSFIVERAAPLFNKKGYAGTSLNDLLAATQLTKGSLYGNFENKEEIALAAFDHNLRWIKEGLQETMGKQESSIGKLMAMTQFYRDNQNRMTERGGCPLVNTGVEADDNMPFLHQRVKEEMEGWIKAVAEIIDKGIASKEIRFETPSFTTAVALVSLIEGGILLSDIMGHAALLLHSLETADIKIKEISL